MSNFSNHHALGKTLSARQTPPKIEWPKQLMTDLYEINEKLRQRQ